MTSSQLSSVKQGHRESVSQRAFEVLQRGTLNSLPGQPVAVLSHTHRQEVFSDVHRKPTVFPIMLIVSGLVTTEKSLFLSSFHPLFRCLAKLVTLFLSLVFTRLKSPRCFSFSSPMRCSSLLNIFISLFWNLSNTPMSLLHCKAQSWKQYSGVVSAVLGRDWLTSVICCLYVV